MTTSQAAQILQILIKLHVYVYVLQIFFLFAMAVIETTIISCAEAPHKCTVSKVEANVIKLM